jgi:hypothetical protein
VTAGIGWAKCAGSHVAWVWAGFSGRSTPLVIQRLSLWPSGSYFDRLAIEDARWRALIFPDALGFIFRDSMSQI